MGSRNGLIVPLFYNVHSDSLGFFDGGSFHCLVRCFCCCAPDCHSYTLPFALHTNHSALLIFY